jgi:hypothetical protein
LRVRFGAEDHSRCRFVYRRRTLSDWSRPQADHSVVIGLKLASRTGAFATRVKRPV